MVFGGGYYQEPWSSHYPTNNFYSIGSILLTSTLLAIAKDESITFTGTLPFAEYENATFECQLQPFNQTQFLSISQNGSLWINSEQISQGDCTLRRVNLPYLFLDIYDGFIKLPNQSMSMFKILPKGNNDGKHRTEFTELFTMDKSVSLVDYSDFMMFDRDLGSTTDFKIDASHEPNSVGLKFTVKDIGSFDAELVASELFPESDPLIGIFEFENEEFSMYFNWRRKEISHYTVSSGILKFKNSNKSKISAIIFGTNGKEMRFQGTTVAAINEETSSKSNGVSKNEKSVPQDYSKAESCRIGSTYLPIAIGMISLVAHQ